MMDSLLNASLLVFGSLAILLAPMALALPETGPGGEGWKLLTFRLPLALARFNAVGTLRVTGCVSVPSAQHTPDRRLTALVLTR